MESHFLQHVITINGFWFEYLRTIYVVFACLPLDYWCHNNNNVYCYRNLNEKVLHTIFATLQLPRMPKPYTRMVLKVLNMIHHKNRFVLIENNERKHDKQLFLWFNLQWNGFRNFQRVCKTTKAKPKEFKRKWFCAVGHVNLNTAQYKVINFKNVWIWRD